MPRSVHKGPFVDDNVLRKVMQARETRFSQGYPNLVAAVDDYSRYGGPHFRGSQRQEIHPRVRY